MEADIAKFEENISARELEMAEKAFFEQGEATAEKVREYESWKRQLARRLEEWEEVAAKLEGHA